MHTDHMPGPIVISYKDDELEPKPEDGGRHVSECEWIFDSGKRITAMYYVDWKLYRDPNSNSWFISFCMTVPTSMSIATHNFPEVSPHPFYISDDEANSLINTKHIPDRGHMIEDLMDKHRDGAFFAFEGDWADKPEVPEIKFKREEATK